MKHKKAKALYTMSAFKETNDTWKWQEKKNPRWHSPFLFQGRWTGRCLVCKSIRVHAHTQAYSVSYPDWILSPFRGDEELKFSCFVVFVFCQPVYFYSVISYISQPENLLGLVFHLTSGQTKTMRATGSNSEKNKNCTLYFGLSSTFCGNVGSLFSLSDC